MSTADDLRDEVGQAWETFRAHVDRLGAEGLREVTPSGWTVAEMLAHVAFWDEATTATIEYRLRDRPVPADWRFGSGYAPEDNWPSADVHNAREAAWAREQSPDRIVERLDDAHAALVEALAAASEEEVAAHGGSEYRHIGVHYDEHLPELETLLDGTGAAG